MTSPGREPNPTRWIGPVLCCAVPDPDAYEGICGLPIESEPCPKHGTDVPPIPAEAEHPAACQLVDVPGVGTMRVQGDGPFDEKSRAYLAEIVEAVKRRYIAEHGDPDA